MLIFLASILLVVIILAAAYIGHRIDEIGLSLIGRPEPQQPDFTFEIERIDRELSRLNKTLAGGFAALIAIGTHTQKLDADEGETLDAACTMLHIFEEHIEWYRRRTEK